MAPRISMLTAVDRLGNIYLCLSQSNSNKSTIGLFMEKLVLKLDQQNAHWRNSTVVCWDGASYHKARSTYDMLERLRVPIMMAGPYSYDAHACELFFAAFKKDDVNPSKVPLGKGHLETILKLVIQRCQQISKAHLILNWHHSAIYAFRYLLFHKI
jgi:hypothetical protein